jgi:hypothetical protein
MGSVVLMRYFRCDAGDEAYEQARLALDAAWGHPNAETKTQTCIDPAAVAPRDAAGRIVLAVNDEFCAYPAAEEMLSLMLSGGSAAEITADEYASAAARTPPE